jgi:hypothetical protein
MPKWGGVRVLLVVGVNSNVAFVSQFLREGLKVVEAEVGLYSKPP